MPAPWIRRLTGWPFASCMLKAVYSKMVLIAFGVSGFRAGERRAVRFDDQRGEAGDDARGHARAGQASRYRLPLSSRVGLLSTSMLSGAAGATILWPGAMMSGLT